MYRLYIFVYVYTCILYSSLYIQSYLPNGVLTEFPHVGEWGSGNASILGVCLRFWCIHYHVIRRDPWGANGIRGNPRGSLGEARGFTGRPQGGPWGSPGCPGGPQGFMSVPRGAQVSRDLPGGSFSKCIGVVLPVSEGSKTLALQQHKQAGD